MRQTFTLSFKNILPPLLLQLVLVLCVVVQGYGQTQIFPEGVETMGGTPVAATTSISAHENTNGFVNWPALDFAGTGNILSTSTLASSGYSGASGGNHVGLGHTTSVPNQTFEIHNINSVNYTDITLGLGYRGSSTALNTVVEYSTNNGSSWTSLGTIATATDQVNIWRFVTLSGVPAVEDLALKFTRTGGTGAAIRIDDVQLTGAQGAGIQSFTPTSGGMGTVITITGTGLGNVAEAYFYDSFAYLEILSVSDTAVVVEVVELPADLTQPQQIVLYGDAEYISEGFFTFQSPIIESLFPNSGVAGDEISISGERLNIGGTPTVQFTRAGGGFTTATVTSDSETFLTVIVPSDATTGPITVTTTEGSATSETFTIEEPTIDSFTPTSGPVGTTVTITGTNLLSTSVVRFGGGIEAVPESTNDTTVVVIVPTGAQTGVLEAVTDIGTATSTETFTVLRPTITSIFPTSARVGQNIVINGSRLNIGGIPTVTFTGGAVATTVTSNTNGTQLQVTVPAGAQTGPITVTTTEGSATSPTFTLLAPTITITGSLAPFSTVVGTPSEPQTYSVSASNLSTSMVISAPSNFQIWRPNAGIWDQTRTLTPDVNGNIASTTITVRYNPAAAGSHGGNITHVANDGAVVETLAVTGVADPARPTIESVTPSSSRIGQTIEIKGTRFDQGDVDPIVTFNNVREGEPRVIGQVTNFNATSIFVTVPLTAASGSLDVTTQEGMAEFSNFIVLRPDVTLSGTLATFETNAGVPSDPQTYTLSAVNLIESVFITAPENFQISYTETDGYVSLLEAPMTDETDGSLSATTIYVRYFPAEEGVDNDSIANVTEGESEIMEVAGIAGAPLPVELVSFTAEQKGAATLLKWVTASEQDNSHFEVEVSENPEAGFTMVGKVESKVVNSSVTNRYQYVHNVKSAGTFYYRLKQVDLDGTYAYSNVVAVEAKGVAATSVMVAPNPLIPESRIIVEAASAGKAIMRLTSMTGQQVYFREVEVEPGQNEFALPYYDKLQNAAYILTVELNGKVTTTKVVKQ